MAATPMTTPPRTPTTAAGRAKFTLASQSKVRFSRSEIAAIEAEARTPLDVERLAVAIRKVERENDLRDDTELGVKPMDGPPPHWYEGYAAAIAAAYEGSKE